MAQKVGIAVGVAAPVSLGICAVIWKYCGGFLDCVTTVFSGGDKKDDKNQDGDEESTVADVQEGKLSVTSSSAVSSSAVSRSVH